MNEHSPKIIKGLKIDPHIFTFRFSCKCSGECCLYGVFTDFKEYEKIISIKTKIIPVLDETQSTDIKKWFEQPEKDEDFESGVAVGTNIVNSKCAFLDKNGLCTLQKLADAEGSHKWAYKPIYCILFPLTVYEASLTIDDEHIDRLKTCNKNPISDTTIFEACREELRHFFGEEAFNELVQYKDEYLNLLKAKEVA